MPWVSWTLRNRPGKADRRWLLVVVALGLAARLAATAPLLGRLDDPDNYLRLARSGRGARFRLDGRPTAYRPPLYPLVLAPLVAVLRGNRSPGASPCCTWRSGRGRSCSTAWAAARWGLGPARVLLAAAIVALDPVLVAQSRMVMTETLAAFLLAASLAALTRPASAGAALGGLALGLAALLPAEPLPAALLVAIAAAGHGPGPGGQRFGQGVAGGGGDDRHARPLGRAERPRLRRAGLDDDARRLHAGPGEQPVYYAEVLDGPPGAVWSGPNQQRWFDAIGPTVAGLSEPEADRRLRRVRWRLAARGPATLPGPRPRGSGGSGASPRPARSIRGRSALVAALWTVPLWVALVAGLSRRGLWRWPRVAAPAMLLALSAVHAFYWTDLRMRARSSPPSP